MKIIAALCRFHQSIAEDLEEYDRRHKASWAEAWFGINLVVGFLLLFGSLVGYVYTIHLIDSHFGTLWAWVFAGFTVIPSQLYGLWLILAKAEQGRAEREDPTDCIDVRWWK